jgi:hypothetical protein
LTEDQLIQAIQKRAADPDTRRDYKLAPPPPLYPPAEPKQIDAAEATLGFSLHPLHRRLLAEVGNGGFGPGRGLVGVAGGHLAYDASLVELQDDLGIDDAGRLPPGVTALCDWGDEMWSLLDEKTGDVLTLSGTNLVKSKWTIRSWWEDWLKGRRVLGKFTRIQSTAVNPFTGEKLVFKNVGKPFG